MDTTSINSLREGDMFRTESGIIGIKLYEQIYSTADIERADDIKEIRKGLFNKIIDKKVNFEKLWDSIQKNPVFLGISTEASSADSEKIKESLEDFEIIEYNPSEDNYKKLIEATRHIIIPPLNFSRTHIIEEKLLSQIKERQKVKKSSEIYVEGKIFPITEVYELKGEDSTKSAVIIY